MDHVKLSESGWLWMIDPIWTSTFAAWQQSLKCKQTAFKTVVLFAARLEVTYRWLSLLGARFGVM